MADAWPDALAALWEAGGSTMPALAACAAALWYALAWRALVLLPRSGDAPERLWARAVAGEPVRTPGVVAAAVRRLAARRATLASLPEARRAEAASLAVGDLRDTLGRHRTLATSLVVAAPLLGLLGTVSGMIETFDALGQQAMFRQGGGIAGGIAEALITTEVGLCIAIPGTLVGRLLDRREDRLRRELDHLETLLRRDGGVT